MTLPGSQQPDLLLLIGWTWFHFLWQAIAIALLLRMTLWVIPARPARFRYLACCLALIILLATPLVTFILLRHDGPSQWLRFTPKRPMLAASDGIPSQWILPLPSEQTAGFVRRYVQPYIPLLGGIWALAQMLFSARSIVGYSMLHRMRKQLLSDDALQYMVDRLAREAGLHATIKGYLSNQLSSPVTWGWLKPVVVMPVAVMSNLNPWEVELLIRHELAHIKRWDYFVNLLQVIAVDVLGLHPAVSWVSRRISEHREYCCDEAVIASPAVKAMPYARTLTNLEKLRLAIPDLAMGASGGNPLARVRRIAIASPSRSGLHGNTSALFVNIVVAVLALAASSSAVSTLHAAGQRQRFEQQLFVDSVYDVLGRRSGDDKAACILLEQKLNDQASLIAFARSWNRHSTARSFWNAKTGLRVTSMKVDTSLFYKSVEFTGLARDLWQLAVGTDNKQDARELAIAAISVLAQDPMIIPSGTGLRLLYDPLLPEKSGLSPRQITDLQLLASLSKEQTNRFFADFTPLQQQFLGEAKHVTSADERKEVVSRMRKLVATVHMRFDLQWKLANAVYRYNQYLKGSQLALIRPDELFSTELSTNEFGEQPLPVLLSEAESVAK